MKYFLNKLKLVATGIMALSFFMVVTLSSCGSASNQSDDDAEATEEQVDATSEEHPAGDEEQPAGDEEHPSDSTAGEHPEGE